MDAAAVQSFGVTKRRLLGRLALFLGYAFLILLVAGFGAFFVLAILRLLAQSIGLQGFSLAGLTAQNWLTFLVDPFHRQSLLTTFEIAGITTAVTLVIGFPLALHINAVSPARRGVFLLLLLSPLLISVVLRTYGWVIILGSQGLISWLLEVLGLINSPQTLMYNKTAVVIALTQVFLPQLVLPIFVSLQQQDPRLVKAAGTLGASPARAFFDVTLPLALPGVVAGSATVFALAAGSYVTVSLIGGPRVFTLPITVADQALGLFNWDFAAGAGGLLLLINIAVLVLVTSYIKSRQKGVFGH